MNHSAKITSKGQITLPAEIRKQLGLDAGDRIDFVKNAAGNFEIRGRKHRFADLFGIVKLNHAVDDEDIVRWVQEARGRSSLD